MTVGGDPAALGQLLRSRRERLVPADVGLTAGWAVAGGPAGGPAGGRRRRAPGLRREEVALLANVSVTYYTYLEQGRPVRPSVQVLDALASALRMSAAERRYLHVLAYGPGGAGGTGVTDSAGAAGAGAGGDAGAVGAGAVGAGERLDPAVDELVQRLEPFPSLVKGRRWDVLAANPAARELFGDWGVGSAGAAGSAGSGGSSGTAGPAGSAGAGGERNLVRWMFTTDQAREVYLEWELEARALLGRFRLAAARHPDDPDVRALIAELLHDSEHVRDWWPRHDVAAIGSGSKKLRHPRLGPMVYTHVVLQVADSPDQTLVTYSPAIPLGSGQFAAPPGP
jgi:transcriptional regulator with XRE-family HTH domain